MADTDQISRVAAVNATRAGGEAQRAGKHVSDCPHDVAGSPEERFLASFWVKGHSSSTTAP